MIVRETGGKSYDIKSGFDILDNKLLKKAVNGAQGIFHCAAKISVPESISNPSEYHRINVEGTRSVVDASDSIKVKIVFSSSAAVYGDTTIAVNEESDISPKSPYAHNKVDGENNLKISLVPHIALRYFNVYGPGQSSQYAGVITSFIKDALNGRDLIIYGDGNQVRDFIFVSDVVKANVIAMKYRNNSFEVFNIGSGIGTSIKELANMVIRLTGSTSRVVYEASRLGDIVYSRADISKAERLLKWRPEISLEDGLRETISFYKSIMGM